MDDASDISTSMKTSAGSYDRFTKFRWKINDEEAQRKAKNDVPLLLGSDEERAVKDKKPVDEIKVKQEAVEVNDDDEPSSRPRFLPFVGSRRDFYEGDSVPKISGILKTELLELTTGDDIIEEANKIFNSKQKDGGPKVSMAFKFIKKGKSGHKSKSGGASKKVKLIITSKKTLAAAMAAAEKGQNPEEVMLQLNKAGAIRTRKHKRHNKTVPLSLQPSWSVIDAIEKSLNSTDIQRELVQSKTEEFAEDNFRYGDDKDQFDDVKNDPDYMSSLSSVIKVAAPPKKKRGRKKGWRKKILDEEEENGKEEINDVDFIDEENNLSGDDNLEHDSKPLRKRNDGVVKMESTQKMGPKRKRRKLQVPNTLDRSQGLSSMDLESYVVKVSAKWPRTTEGPVIAPIKTEADESSTMEENEVVELKVEKQEYKEENGDSFDDDETVDEGDVINQLGDRKIYGCVFCEYTGRKQNWITHLKTKHQDQRILFCNRTRVCNMPFQSESLLEKHIEETHGNRHSCDICQKQFQFPSGLKNHMQRHLSEDSVEKRKHICPYCGKKFSTRTGYRSHEAHTHTLNLRHKCDWEGCEKAYFSLTDLVIHKRGHTGECPYTCSYCGTGFVAKQRLVQHEKIMHLDTGKMDVECEVCHKKIRKKHLSYHLKTHKGLTKAWCSVCGKEFPTSGGKKRHEKIHFNVKNHSCRFCGKSFVQKANMDAHERIHTGVKPYSCKHCGECFVQGTRRNQHQNTCRHKPSMMDPEQD